MQYIDVQQQGRHWRSLDLVPEDRDPERRSECSSLLLGDEALQYTCRRQVGEGTVSSMDGLATIAPQRMQSGLAIDAGGSLMTVKSHHYGPQTDGQSANWIAEYCYDGMG